MKTQFDEFDKDQSGFLDKSEFRSCLYSMGEERGKKEIEAILVKLGNGDADKVRLLVDLIAPAAVVDCCCCRLGKDLLRWVQGVYDRTIGRHGHGGRTP